MNKRIKKLAEQAGIYKLNLSDETEYWIMEKFAELIVKDCIRTLHSNGYDDAAQCLQDTHFGIEYPV